MYKAIIFDMDGVVFDTEKILIKCWEEAGKDFNLNIESKHLTNMRGGTIDIIKNAFEENFGTDIDFYKVRERREVIREEYIQKNGVPVKEGIEDFFKYLKSKNIKIALGSSNFSNIAIDYLKSSSLYKYFDEIVCGDMVQNGKPSPEIFLEACKRLNVAPKDALVFEDSRNGIIAGYNAGCDVVMVVDIDDSYEDTEDKIVLKIDNYKQAIDFLETIKER